MKRLKADTSKSFDDYTLSPEAFASNEEDKGTMVSPKFIYNSPEKLIVRERIKFVEGDSWEKLFETRRQLQRKSKQVCELQNIVEELKSKQLLNPDQGEMLSILDGMDAEIFNCMYKKSTGEPLTLDCLRKLF